MAGGGGLFSFGLFRGGKKKSPPTVVAILIPAAMMRLIRCCGNFHVSKGSPRRRSEFSANYGFTFFT